ncbi:hypothetical protein [Bifidobacterium sp. SO1]|uniref:hypothetical protein n=1 Tax=Bifidobacterium sp. SO1 TaxID=2809029 RepID=UPI001BDDC021|nr:hypothetical protein [Bifidobacterium sp. SO1]
MLLVTERSSVENNDSTSSRSLLAAGFLLAGARMDNVWLYVVWGVFVGMLLCGLVMPACVSSGTATARIAAVFLVLMGYIGTLLLFFVVKHCERLSSKYEAV